MGQASLNQTVISEPKTVKSIGLYIELRYICCINTLAIQYHLWPASFLCLKVLSLIGALSILPEENESVHIIQNLDMCIFFQSVFQKKGIIGQRCIACGYQGNVDMRHKLTTFIIKNPPEAFSMHGGVSQMWPLTS